MAKKPINTSASDEQSVDKFKIVKGKIREMYADDKSIRHNVNKTSTTAATLNSTDVESIRSNYYNLTPELENQRKYSYELYTFYPVYANLLDYLSNMFLWRYTYTPRIIKEKANAVDYEEIYSLMGDVVDGLSLETTLPMVLTQLFIEGAVYLITVKNTASKTISTLALPTKYCRVASVSQFGTYLYQFDFSYFDSLNLSNAELEIILNFYPKEMIAQYRSYLTDKQNLRWQLLDGKYAAAIMANKYGFPTKLNAIFSIKNYDEYLENELERNEQLLDKIIAHKMPTWEDRLVVDIDEMAELHQSLSRILSSNAHVRLMTTFGDMEVLSIGEDQTKENKTLTNAYEAIYNNAGENATVFNGESVEALKYALKRDESLVWKYIMQLINYYNIAVNNSFNFKGYQCDITMLPITVYNEQEKILLYKEGATLGITKLEYVVSTGVKQIDLASKFALEDFLHLDKLKPLSTSYTQNDNSKQGSDENEEEQSEEDTADETSEDSNEPEKSQNSDQNKEQEVDINEEDTK